MCNKIEEENELNRVAMQIILNAGDARVFVKESLDKMKSYDFVIAKEKLDIAQDYIKKAHAFQTGIIQGEAQGEKYNYSLLFNHAQDTLMTIYSELNIAKQLLGIFESLNDRLIKIENNMK